MVSTIIALLIITFMSALEFLAGANWQSPTFAELGLGLMMFTSFFVATVLVPGKQPSFSFSQKRGGAKFLAIMAIAFILGFFTKPDLPYPLIGKYSGSLFVFMQVGVLVGLLAGIPVKKKFLHFLGS
jgi:hypothetical protein